MTTNAGTWDWQHEIAARRSDAYGAGLRDGKAAYDAGRPASSCDPADWDERYAANYRNGWEHAWHDANRAAEAPVCVKCNHPVMRSYGGWGHAPGYRGKRHIVVVA